MEDAVRAANARCRRLGGWRIGRRCGENINNAAAAATHTVHQREQNRLLGLQRYACAACRISCLL
jgi:hypothetical protein